MSEKKTFNYDPSWNDRVDGVDKVTGKARYAAEYSFKDIAYGVFITSTIARGRVRELDVTKAMQAPGVLEVISYKNCPALPGYKSAPSSDNQTGEWRGFNVLQDNIVRFHGQPIALLLADSIENANAALKLVKATYDSEPFETDFEKARKVASNLKPPVVYKRGKELAYLEAPLQVEGEYTIPIEVHNPMELQATIAVWEAEDRLTLYDKTQGPQVTQFFMSRLFGLKQSNVRVIAAYVGGAFGNALRSWPNVPAACIAAKMLKRPVKVMLTRPQMFTLTGYRPQSWQKIAIGADNTGKLIGISHWAVSNTSRYEDFREGIVDASRFLYACPHVNTSYSILPLDLSTPTWMRGPGEASGCFALECALDDLSYKIGIDPITLRVMNFSEVHAENKKPWSGNNLLECYEKGKEMIGWGNRPSQPGSLKEGEWNIGYGMAVGVFGAGRGAATVKATLDTEGMLVLECGVSDMGPGTSTSMVTIVADNLRWPKEKIRFEMGDSSLPPGPMQGGSGTTSTLGSAVLKVCETLSKEMKTIAKEKIAAFKDVSLEDIVLDRGYLYPKSNEQGKIAASEIVLASGKSKMEWKESSQRLIPEQFKFAAHSFSVHFTRLKVHQRTGEIKLMHIVTIGDAGKIINEKTARSQMIGGVVGGIGMALTEEVKIDHSIGKISNANFAEYKVPRHTQIPQIDVWFVDKPDKEVNALGAKGLAEISLIGLAASIGNAVYNATGQRVRDLPITPEKLGFPSA
jgi:xanthine dehydrogenase YagR molybdenum-binding subunit